MRNLQNEAKKIEFNNMNKVVSDSYQKVILDARRVSLCRANEKKVELLPFSTMALRKRQQH
jgi:hypothetical protein